MMECDRWGVCEPVVVIGKRSGEMTATMVDDDGAFVASGMRTAS